MIDKILKITSIVACIVFIVWVVYMAGYVFGYMDGAQFAISELTE